MMFLNKHSKKIINRMGLNVCDKTGVVLSPGKFENEMYYVPVFWDYYLEGSYDDTFKSLLEDIVFFKLDDDDISNFPELKGFEKFILTICERGFVSGRMV